MSELPIASGQWMAWIANYQQRAAIIAGHARRAARGGHTRKAIIFQQISAQFYAQARYMMGMTND